ncbi:hypothetical protein J4437_05360 [Candidatus Woesearchaeota archaeon]|nr:hypothetical protein [Candidatus Woesearchaeota archaeon]
MTKIQPKIVEGDGEPVFDGPDTAVADLLDDTPKAPADNISTIESTNTLSDIMGQYIQDYSILISEKLNFLKQNGHSVSDLIPIIEPQGLMVYAPYLRFDSGMHLKTVPITIPQLKEFISKTDSDLSYLVENADLIEKGLIKDGFNLQSEQIKAIPSKTIWAPPNQNGLNALWEDSRNNVAIPNFYFLSLFLENGEILRNYLKFLHSNLTVERSEGKYNQTHFFAGLYHHDRMARLFKGSNIIPLANISLSVAELRKFSEATSEKRIAGLMTEIPNFYSALNNYSDLDSIKKFCYSQLTKHTPQLTI